MYTHKNPEIVALADEIAKGINPDSKGLNQSQVEQVCVLCNEPADTFKDELSAKEYKISGTCQKCQDSIFGQD